MLFSLSKTRFLDRSFPWPSISGSACMRRVQLLGEMSDMGTPYSRVLRTILQNLEQAIYSNYVTPIAGGAFEQVLPNASSLMQAPKQAGRIIN